MNNLKNDVRFFMSVPKRTSPPKNFAKWPVSCRKTISDKSEECISIEAPLKMSLNNKKFNRQFDFMAYLRHVKG